MQLLHHTMASERLGGGEMLESAENHLTTYICPRNTHTHANTL